MIEDAVQSLWKFLEQHRGLHLISVGVESGLNTKGDEIFVTVRAPIPDFIAGIVEWEGFKVRVLRKVG